MVKKPQPDLPSLKTNRAGVAAARGQRRATDTTAVMSTGAQSADAMAAAILRDPCASYWLKAAVDACMKRDCLDALRDAETLVALLRKVAL